MVPKDSIPPELRTDLRDYVERPWLLREVHHWLVEDENRFFLLSGDPGTGKSAFCSWLLAGPDPQDPADQNLIAEVRSSWSAAFFCSTRLTSTSIDPRDFSRSLNRQFASQESAFNAYISRRLGLSLTSHVEVNQNFGQVQGINIEYLSAGGGSASDTFALEVRDPLIALLEEDPQRTVAILVDGLDEAVRFPSPNICNLINNLHGLPGNLKVFLTSRNDPPAISTALGTLPNIHRVDLSTQGTRELADADVRDYVSAMTRRYAATSRDASRSAI